MIRKLPASVSIATALWLAAATAQATDASAQAQMDTYVQQYQNQEFAPAYEGFKSLADQGHVEAQYFLGVYFMYGGGDEPPRPDLSRKWFKQALDGWTTAAQGGDPVAMVEIANMYNTGLGVDRDPAAALVWARKAAELDHPEAWATLGDMYLAGDGVKKDMRTAADWYQKASDSGNEHGDMALRWMRRQHPEVFDASGAQMSSDS